MIQRIEFISTSFYMKYNMNDIKTNLENLIWRLKLFKWNT